jgi:hypothetical protein
VTKRETVESEKCTTVERSEKLKEKELLQALDSWYHVSSQSELTDTLQSATLPESPD